MKLSWRFLCAFLFLSFTVSAQRNIDVTRYQFSVTLNDLNDTIAGQAVINFIWKNAADSISLDLTSINSKNKGMTVDQVLLVRGATTIQGFRHTADKINIKFSTAGKKGDSVSVSVSYHGIPADGLIISKNKYNHRTFFADNWPNRGHNWIPCVDDPGDKAAVDFIITAPAHYETISNGIKIEETSLTNNRKLSHWREDVAIGTKVMVIGAAEFAVQLSGMINDCIPVYSYVYPEDREKGFYDYSLAASILPFFIKEVGPYGYKKLANVQSKTLFGGLENANTIFYAENSITGTRASETLLAHEIAHQWFGNMATEKSFAHLWLSEGFATFMTIYYMEKRYGQDTANYMLMKDRQQVAEFARGSERSVVDEDKDYMALLNSNSYAKGGWILHMLRRELGDTTFFKGVRTYYAEYAGKNADTRDLQAVFEKVSGKKLNVFFDQWLYKPGVPELEISWKNVSGAKGEVLIVQKQKNTFVFPLTIRFKSAGGKVWQEKFQVSQMTQRFKLQSGEKISSVEVDPGMSLLFSAKVGEGK